MWIVSIVIYKYINNRCRLVKLSTLDYVDIVNKNISHIGYLEYCLIILHGLFQEWEYDVLVKSILQCIIIMLNLFLI